MNDLIKIGGALSASSHISKQIIELFTPFWEAHTLPRNWMEIDTSHYMTEEKPVFHGLVLAADEAVLRDADRYLRKLFNHHGMWMSGGMHDCIYNRAGEWTLSLLNANRTLDEIIRNRSYDIVLCLDFEQGEDFKEVLKPHLRDGNISRIINVRN